MEILGFGINGYKNFQKEIQLISPLGKMNIFIGKNNSGKSNILLFLERHFSNIAKCAGNLRTEILFNEEEIPLIRNINKFEFAIQLDCSEDEIARIINKANFEEHIKAKLIPLIKKICSTEVFKRGSEKQWFYFEAPGLAKFNSMKLSQDYVGDFIESENIHNGEWQSLSSLMIHSMGIGTKESWIPNVLLQIYNLFIKDTDFEDIVLIPAIRRIEKKDVGTQDWEYGGRGLIDRLAILQNPDFPQLEEQKKFDQINEFLRDVTENNSANLSIPHNRETILVQMDDKTLPLSSLGTGIHEVIVLAATVTTFDNRVICIEEPELHLHPYLQEKLINYLIEKTSNQYFITTHSSQFINTPGAKVFHVSSKDNQAIVKLAISNDEKFEICRDLGYHASDLLQSNCIIWVEGPSDRIYLNHWIRNKNADLVEGLHYSVMFYGGKLLSHLSIDEERIRKFIDLKTLNRNVSIVMDSDKKQESDQIRETVQRISSEFNNDDGFPWITQGREIENYLPQDVLLDSIKKLDSTASSLKDYGQYSKVIAYLREDGSERNIDKVKLANEVVRSNADFSILDLDEKITSLVNFVKVANE